LIEIIKHGHKPIEVTCKRCECIFRFDKEDLRTEYSIYTLEVINCPECGYRLSWPLGEKSGLRYKPGDAPPF